MGRGRLWTRRGVLAGAAAAGLGTLLPSCGGGGGSTDTGSPRGARGARVVLAPMANGADGGSVESAARDAIDELGGLGWLGRGDSVLLKVASNSANPFPATTRPELVAAMVRILLAEGAGRVILGELAGVQTVHWTASEQRGSTRETVTTNGLARAALEAGAELVCFEEQGYDAFFEGESPHAEHWRGPLLVPALVGQVDHIVYLPRVSTHMLGGATLSLKAAVGWLREDSRRELHQRADTFLAKCAEIASVTAIRDRIRLVMSDASKVLTTLGPDTGFTVAVDPPMLVASTNPALHDVAAHGLLSYARGELTPEWARALDSYPLAASGLNRAFVAAIWGVGAALDGAGFSAPPRGRALDNPIIRRGVEIWSPDAPRPELVWTAAVPDALRQAIDDA